jgi:DNA-binding SARP family transcriptional activator
MEFRILGSLQVLDGDTPVEIAGTKQRAVLALLILRANEVVGSERLIDELWGDNAPQNAAGALHNHVSRLRKALGPDVLARREWGYVLRTPPETIDLRRFEALLAEGEPLPARERAAKLAEALSLWTGPPLAGLTGEPALQREIARLEELHVSTIERRIDADLEAGRNSELVGELETLIAENPLREHLRWQLILALYRAERQAEALEVYRETRRVLAEELGLDPSPELRELEKAILRQDPSLAAAAVPPAQVAAAALAVTEPRQSRRRLLLAGLLGLLVLGSGVAAAVALVVADEKSAAEPVVTEKSIVITQVETPTTTVVTTTVQQSAPKHTTRESTTTTPQSTTTATAPHATTVVVFQPAPPAAPPTTTTHPRVTHRTTTTPKKTSPATKTTRTTTVPKQSPSKSVTISDSFGATYVDPTIWHQITTDNNVSIAEQGGQLVITVGANAQPGGQYDQIDAHVGTQCRWPGNFDARVDYTLLEWPAKDNVFVGLNAIYADSAVGRQFHPQWGDQYTGWVTPNGGSVPLPDTSGRLRIARVNGVETTYFWHNGGWQRLADGISRGAAVFGLQAMWFPNGGNAPFGGQEAKVAFDNFTVTGANPYCAPGSQPPGT